MPGTLTKADIIAAIQTENDYTLNKSTDIVKTLLKIIKSTLASGEDVMISGFGKFNVKNKKERRGRNPATGDDAMVSARKVVTFKGSGKLKEKINGKKS